jgi:cell division cycle 2-like protein
VTAEQALKHPWFAEQPLPKDPALFPTWPAKSELGHRKTGNSPKPPSGGGQYKNLGLGDDDEKIMARYAAAAGPAPQSTLPVPPAGPGFTLKF